MTADLFNDFEAIKTPIGSIPKYDDLKALFKLYLDNDYAKEDYIEQFSIRIPKLLAKLDRVEKYFEKEQNIPKFFMDTLNNQREALNSLKEKAGKDIISPEEF